MTAKHISANWGRRWSDFCDGASSFIPATSGSPFPLRRSPGSFEMFVCAQALGRPPLPCLFVISGFVHVSQDAAARIDVAPLARMDKVQAQFLDGVRDFSHASCQRSGNRHTAFAAVYCSQWLLPPPRLGTDGTT